MDSVTIELVKDLTQALNDEWNGKSLPKMEARDLMVRTAFWMHCNIQMTDNAVIDDEGNLQGYASKWNPVGLGECIVNFTDGSADSMIFSETKFANGSDKARDFLNARERNG